MAAPSHRYVLAIDLGTSGPKVAVVEDTGRIAASAQRRNVVQFLPDGGAEQDPHEWWATVREAAREVVRASGVAREAIAAIGCTGQWSTVVPVGEDGEPTMNAVSWLDGRGAKHGRKVASGFPSVQGYGVSKLVRWIRLVGTPPTQTGADSLSHMLFVQHERPEVYRRTRVFLEPVDFLNLKLTGRAAASQVTAMPMILTDNRTTDCLDWDAKLVKLSGLAREKLPELVPNDAVLGPVLPAIAEELGLAPGTPVIAGSGDNHTAAIGAGAVLDHEAALVIGTSGFLSAHVPKKKTDLLRFIGTVPSPLSHRHLIFAEQGGAGRVLDAFLATQGESGDGAYDRMNALAGQAEAGSGGVLFLPWFGGTLSPHEDPRARGGFVNLSYRTTRAELTRAVLEGIALNFRWLLGAVESFLGRPLPAVRFAGGGARSDVWAQILADTLGLPVQQLDDPRNGNARGIAFLAFLRLGLLSLEQIPERVAIRRVYEPRAQARAVHDGLFEQFLACRKRLTPVFHRLNRRP